MRPLLLLLLLAPRLLPDRGRAIPKATRFSSSSRGARQTWRRAAAGTRERGVERVNVCLPVSQVKVGRVLKKREKGVINPHLNVLQFSVTHAKSCADESLLFFTRRSVGAMKSDGNGSQMFTQKKNMATVEFHEAQKGVNITYVTPTSVSFHLVRVRVNIFFVISL